MKKLVIISAVAVSFTACSCQRDLAERCAAQEELINKYEILLDSIYRADSNLFLDVIMEEDCYYEYVESKEKVDNLK